MNKSLSIILLSLVMLLPACIPQATASRINPANVTSEVKTLKIAVLPIIDTLPMYVASQEGLFGKYGVGVEFVPVASAPERDQLISAGGADGTINETLAVMLFNREDVQLQVVRYALRPTKENGHFFILASAQSGISSIEGLKGVEIGVSQGTIIEYATERLLQAEGLAPNEIKTIAVPKIPDRMALLASGELNAGVMPDPLAALAVSQGGVVIVDDSNFPQFGFSVISFRKDVIDANPQAINDFLAAIEEATELINAEPEKYKNVLSDQKLVPPSLLETYRVPDFPTAGVPTVGEWKDALSWLKEKGILTEDVSYEGSVNRSFLP